MSYNNHSKKPLRVLMMPDYRIDNPYQKLLADAIQKYDVQVCFPIGYHRVFPITRAVLDEQEPIDIFHLHWLETYVKGENIFVHLVYAVKFLIDILLVRLLGIKVVWTIHNYLEHDTHFSGLELWVRQILVKLTNKVIVHNQSFIAPISQKYKFAASKAITIPHGHYRSVYGDLIAKSEARNKLNLPLNKLIYLNLGMIRPYKGVENLLRVWQTHEQTWEDSLLLIAGNPLNQEYGQKIQEQITQVKNVVLHDYFIPNQDINVFFSAADIVILPFQNVLTSGSVILAMSFGKPIIAPKIGSLPELLSQADSLLYDPKDEQGLESAISHSRNCNLQKLSHLMVTACDNLDWQKIGYETVEVYKQCLMNS